MNFEEIKNTANILVDAYLKGESVFNKVFNAKVTEPKLSIPDIYGVCSLAEVYLQTKKGQITKNETLIQQCAVKREWNKMLVTASEA